MQEDFHYYATYCAAVLAGWEPEQSADIAYCANLVDLCSATMLGELGAPVAAATTQLQMEMMDIGSDPIGLQTVTRIWSSFHFLPYDLAAKRKGCSKRYLRKYRLICKPNGALLAETVGLAQGKGLAAAGIAMHVLADTWAHQNFAGTPSLVINNTDSEFYELVPGEEGETERKISFRHALGVADDIEQGVYTNTPFQFGENSIFCLGHGRAGHLPDYSFARYRYQPAWADYELILKDNPSDYRMAFAQMVYALKRLRLGDAPFECERYDFKAIAPYEDRIAAILTERRLDACDDWRSFGKELSGAELASFDVARCQDEYRAAAGEARDATLLGSFILAALAQKSMVTNRIFSSGNPLAGRSVEYRGIIEGIRDYAALLGWKEGETR